MSIQVLLTTLEEYFKAREDYAGGCLDKEGLQDAKKRVAQSLNQYIDWRADGVLEERRRRISTNQSVHIADLLTSNMGFNSAISALNSAPLPLQNDIDLETFKNWMKTYRAWYIKERKNGLSK